MLLKVYVKLTDNSLKVKGLAAEAIAASLEAVDITAEGYAKAKCPVRTGRLRNSLTHTTKSETEYIGTRVEYGKYVELGARTQAKSLFKICHYKSHGQI